MNKLKLFLSLLLCAALMLSGGPVIFAEAEATPTFKIIAASLNPNTEDLNDNVFLRDLATQAGIEIEYECVYTDWSVKRATLLASGDLPDAFIGWQVLTLNDVSNNASLFANLGDLITEESTPNIYDAFARDQTYRNAVTGLDGNIYFLTDRMPFRPDTYTSFLVNRNWLDTLGLDIPETIEDFEKMLVAFRDGDPNGNGIADELPCYMALLGDDAWSISGFMGAFGCSGSITSLFALEGDTLIYQPLTDNYKEYMKWIAHLQAEGLMASELATVDGSQRGARMSNEIPIIGATNAWDKSVLGLHYHDEYVAMPPFAGPNGDRGVAANPAISSYDGQPKLVISEKCADKDALMRFIDLCFIPENAAQCFYGPIGTVLERTDDGLIMVDPPEGISWSAWKYMYAVNGGWPTLCDDAVESLFAKIPESDSAKLELTEVNKPYENGNTIPSLKFTEEESDELSIVKTDVDTYVEKMIVEWFANGNVEEGWDTFISELHNMGVDTYISIYQAAYDRQK